MGWIDNKCIRHPKIIIYFMNLFLIRMDKNSPITGNRITASCIVILTKLCIPQGLTFNIPLLWMNKKVPDKIQIKLVINIYIRFLIFISPYRVPSPLSETLTHHSIFSKYCSYSTKKRLPQQPLLLKHNHFPNAILTVSTAWITAVSNNGTSESSCFTNNPISVQPNIIPSAPSSTNPLMTFL